MAGEEEPQEGGELIGVTPAPPPAPHITSLQLHHHPPLPPEQEVRPLSGPFGLEEDLRILEDIDKTSKKNIWDLKRSKNAKAALGTLALLVVTTVVIGAMFYFMISSTGGPALYFAPPLLLKIRLLVLALSYGTVFLILMAFSFTYTIEGRIKVIPLGRDGKRSNEEVTATSTPKGPFNYVLYSIGIFFQSGNIYSSEEQIVCAPVSRDTFFWRYYKSMMKSWGGAGLLNAIMAIIFLDIFLPFDWLITLKTIAVSFAAGALMIYLAPAFRHIYAVRMSPSTWFWIRKSVPYLMTAIVLCDLLVSGMSLNFYAGAGGMLDTFLANPFVRITLAIPMAFADLSVSAWPAWHSFVIVGAFLVVSYLAYKKLQKIDFPTTCTRLYLSETYVPPLFKGKPKKPATTPFPRVQPTGEVRPATVATTALAPKPDSAKIPWDSVDRGEGPKAIETMLRIMQGKYHQALVPVVMATILWVLTMVLRYLASSNMTASTEMLLMIFPTEVYVLVSLMFGLPTGKRGTEMIDVIRLLPLDGVEVLKAFAFRRMVYTVGPYVAWATLYFASFGYSDAMVFIGVYMFVPALMASISYFSTVIYLLQKNVLWSGMTLMIAYGIAVLFFYMVDFWALGYMPLWLSLSITSAALLLPIPLTGRLVRTALHRPYLKFPGWRTRLRLQAAMVALILIIITMMPLATPAFGVYLIPGTQPMVVSQKADGAQHYVDRDILYKGSLVVPAGSHMTLDNCTLRFKVIQDGKTGIWVEKGGVLEVHDSLITNNYGNYVFYVYGTLSMTNSTVSHSSTGIYVIDGQGFLLNVTVEKGRTYGVHLESTYSTVQNCTIRNNTYSGIRAYTDRSTIRGNLIENNSNGVYATEYSKTEIVGNTIVNNSYHGVYAEDYSTLIIRDNIIVGNKGYGVMMDNAQPLLANNTMANNTRGDLGYPPKQDLGSFFIIMVGMVVGLVIVAVVMVMVAQRRRQRMLQEQEAAQEAPQPIQNIEEKKF